VVEVPDGLLGAANDSWFRYINNPSHCREVSLSPSRISPIRQEHEGRASLPRYQQQLDHGLHGTPKGLKKNDDGSYTVYYGPKAPKGYENNWVETIPGKSWFVILRMYSPLKPWIDQTWRPGEVELVK